MSGYGLSQHDVKSAVQTAATYSAAQGYANVTKDAQPEQHAMGAICQRLDSALQLADEINKNLQQFFVRLKGEPHQDQKCEACAFSGPSLPGVDQRLNFLQNVLSEISKCAYDLRKVA